MLALSDFDFDLPQELIAQYPLQERSASRLLLAKNTKLEDHYFAGLPDLLSKGDLLVFNNTQVLKARFFGNKDTGGKVEVLAERILDNQTVLAKIRASKSPLPGTRIRLANVFDVTVGERVGEFYTLVFPDNPLNLFEAYGHLPLPPYIDRSADIEDETRYQTIYAKEPGAVAAPTAGLHFDDNLLKKLRQKGVEFAYLTLHVGAGTFQPVRTENLAEHKMHMERYAIPQETVDAIHAAQSKNRNIIAVGTTSLRALEAAAQSGTLHAGRQETAIFITPGYSFQIVNRLITNFHLPKSTLLMLVSAFAGYEQIRHAYAHAIAERYRFFSYGDAMLLSRNT